MWAVVRVRAGTNQFGGFQVANHAVDSLQAHVVMVLVLSMGVGGKKSGLERREVVGDTAAAVKGARAGRRRAARSKGHLYFEAFERHSGERSATRGTLERAALARAPLGVAEAFGGSGLILYLYLVEIVACYYNKGYTGRPEDAGFLKSQTSSD